MPNFDRRGPEGKGSRTGRGLGKCNDDNSQNSDDNRNENVEQERFVGRGAGRGFANGNQFRGGQGRLRRNRRY